MFGSNYFGSSYFGQAFARILGAIVAVKRPHREAFESVASVATFVSQSAVTLLTSASAVQQFVSCEVD